MPQSRKINPALAAAGCLPRSALLQPATMRESKIYISRYGCLSRTNPRLMMGIRKILAQRGAILFNKIV